MKNIFLLIALSLMILTGCTTKNPEKAKKKIDRLVKANPSAGSFEVIEKEAEVVLQDLGLEIEADLKEVDLENIAFN
jgi:hypothetical protein